MSPSLFYRLPIRALCAVLLLPLLFAVVHAGEITEGREFHFGIPHIKKPTGEGARGVPIQLWISSKNDNTVVVDAPAIGFSQTHKVKAGTVKIIAIPEGLMNTESEVKRPFGIQVQAVHPIALTCCLSYKVSGEAFSVRPVTALGKSYHALSLWQDQSDEYKPGQILIVAAHDNTKVSYIPSVETEKVKAGKMHSITLQRGETFLVQSKVQPSYNQDMATDLTGSYVAADKPVAVFSGHTKGAYPPFSATMLGTPANFMRNVLFEQMPPIETLGTEYIIVPLQYTNRPYNNVDNKGEGDMVRFVATEDNTDLLMRQHDGSSTLLKGGMQKGEMYEVSILKTATVYTSSKPVLVGHYGKSWRVSTVPPIIDPSGDNGVAIDKKEQTANPPRNGTGCLIVQTPRSQWASRALFRSPDGMNNFVNIVFETADADSIKFNGKYLRAVFGSKVQEIPGTPYSYVASLNAAGDHTIEADAHALDVQFAAYVYGNYDATKDGFAYGYPVGADYALNLGPDSIVVESTAATTCGSVQGRARFLPRKGSFTGFADIQLEAGLTSNYALSLSAAEQGDAEVEFELAVVDPRRDAHAVLSVLDRTGQRATRSYTYTAEDIFPVPGHLALGLVAVGADTCRQLTLVNPTAGPVVVQGIELVNNRAEFSIAAPPFPIAIPADSSIVIDVCGKALTTGRARDSIRVLFACHSPVVAEVNIEAGLALITVGDRDFGEVPVYTESSAELTIQSIGQLPVELYSVDWADKDHFRTEGLLDRLPITLNPGEQFTFTVFYLPTEDNVPNQTLAEFTGNTDMAKLYSLWKGRGFIPVSVHESEPPEPRILSIAPQPFAGTGSARYSLAAPAAVTLSLYTILGERVLLISKGMQPAGEHSVPLDTGHLPPGLYLCRLDAGARSATQTVLVR